MQYFIEFLESYLQELRTKHTEKNNRELKSLQDAYGEWNTFNHEKGSKFVKIVRTDGNQKSVHCFVEIATGNILKAATYKAPQKNGVRGNLIDLNRPVFSSDFYIKY